MSNFQSQDLMAESYVTSIDVTNHEQIKETKYRTVNLYLSNFGTGRRSS